MSDSVLKINRLNGSENYDLWAIRIEAVLTEKGYFSVMTDPENIDIEKRAKALAYIRLSLADGPLLQIRNIQDPLEAWSALKALYEPKGFSSEFLLCKELFQTTLRSYKSVESYLNKIKQLHDDLLARNIAIPNKVIAAWVLNGLTKEYESIIAMITQNIRSKNEDINLQELFSYLIDESRRLQSKENEPMALIQQIKPKKQQEAQKDQKQQKYCNFCKKQGHYDTNCFKKHPEKAPKNTKNTFKNAQNSSSRDEINSEIFTAISTKKEDILLSKNDSIEWILDSGASTHICCDKTLFSSLFPTEKSVNWGNASSITAKFMGNVELIFNSTKQKAILENCLYIPEIGMNLLSLGKLAQKELNIQFYKQKCFIERPKKIIATGYYRNNLSIFDTTIITPISREIACLSVKQDIWHQRMGHIGYKALKELPNAVKGVEKTKEIKNIDCDVCIQAKMTAKISRKPSENSTTYLDLVYSDIGGPFTPKTIGGNKYYVTFLDSATKWAEIRLIKSKNEVYDKFLEYLAQEERNSGKLLKRLHSDNGLEYKNEEFRAFFAKKGIKSTFSAPYAHEQNGAAEILNRTLINKVRSLLINAQLPRYLWGEALNAAVYLYNRTPHSNIDYKTPYEAKYDQKPDLKNIKIWGSIAWKKEKLAKKLDSRAKKSILIGYGSNQYKLLQLQGKKVYWARDAVIQEGKFSADLTENSVKDNEELQDLEILSHEKDQNLDQNQSENSDKNIQKSTENQSIKNNLNENFSSDMEDVIHDDTDWYNQFYHELQEAADEDIMNTIIHKDPLSYKEAMNSSKSLEWQKAMERELKDLNSQKTWILTELPKGQNCLKGRWVYKTKIDEKGNISKYKARWVAKGYLQQYGTEYLETFANTVRPSAFRALFALAAYFNWEIHQWDVKSAFPNAPIEENIFIEQPKGFEQGEKLVCKLKKALYGLKQSARQWQIWLKSQLEEIGCKSLFTDPSIFIYEENTILTAHIDDILIFSPKIENINKIREKLALKMDLSDLKKAKYFLGIEIIRERENRKIILSQRQFIDQIMRKFNKNALKPTENPTQKGIKLQPNLEKASEADIKEFQKEIGSLLYLTTATRPDLAYSVGNCARYMSNPSIEHFNALNKIWRYLAKTARYSLIYQSDQKPLLKGYCDADWGGDYDTRKSTTGYIFLFGNTAISWSSKLQKTVALSSCEAEYMALKEAIKEEEALQTLFKQIKPLKELYSRDIYTDSRSAIELAKNPIFHARSKHIDIQYHYVREANQKGIIKLNYIPTEKQLADGFTKPLDNSKWLNSLTLIGIHPI